jgi:TIGR03118 family protein
VDNSGAGASYTGLTTGNNGSGNFIFAADSANNRIDVFDSNFTQQFGGFTFTDPTLGAGFSVYNIQNLAGTLVVTYENETSGGGIVDAFDVNGNLIRRVTGNANGGPLDSPWGLAIAPSSFGKFGGALLWAMKTAA